MDTLRARPSLDTWLAHVEELLAKPDEKPDEEQLVEQDDAA